MSDAPPETLGVGTSPPGARFIEQLRADLARREQLHLARRLDPVDRCGRIVHRDGRPLLNFAGNDYLALASHPHLAETVADTARRLGTGAGASRLVSGHLEIHREVESRFAAFKHAEAALLLPTGFLANLAVLTALAGPEDLACIDKLTHASLIDAARYSGATVRVYPHRNLDKLRRLLDRSGEARRRFIVTDSVFSMDGDVADLPALCELRDAFDAVLIVDEAHGTGILGLRGSGLVEEQGVAGRIDITISTASKALGSIGGIVTSSQPVIDTLVNHARSFLYTTAVPPTQAAAIGAALDIVDREPIRRQSLLEVSVALRQLLRERGWAVPEDPTPIVPMVVGESERVLAMSSRLREQGFFVPAIRPPTVAPGTARLRISLRCDTRIEDAARLADAIGPAPR